MGLTRDERARRIQELEQWCRDQADEFRDEAFPRDVRAAWDRNRAELEEHRAAMAEFRLRDERLRAIGRHNGSVEEGTIFPDRAVSRAALGTAAEDPRRRQHMDDGLYTIERFKNSGHLSTRSADSLDTMIREHDAGGIGARYLAAVGSPAYESAFEKILRDPQTAIYRF